PNAPITAVKRITGPDDLLLVGTFGRGAWEIKNASATLGTPGHLTISGTSGDDVFKLQRDAAQPWMVDVYESLAGQTPPTKPTLSVQLSSLDYIEIDGRDGDDQFIIDASNGAISVLNGIRITGGAHVNGDTLKIQVDPDVIVLTNPDLS